MGGVQRQGIFQGGSLSPLISVLYMVPLLMALKKAAAGYEWSKNRFIFNRLLFMDGLKLFRKHLEKFDPLVQTAHVFSKDGGMEFGLHKCGLLCVKRGKLVTTWGLHLFNIDVMEETNEEGYEYVCMLETDKIREEK